MIIGIAVLVVVLGLLGALVPYMKMRGYNFGNDVIVRCAGGHLYMTIWIPGGSLKAVRWGTKRYQRCPVGKHWSLTSQVKDDEITPEIIEEARKFHDIRIF